MPQSAGLRLQPDPSRYTLPAFLEDVCQRHAGSVALRFEGNDFGFDELRSDVRALAKGLVAAGVVKGARVAVMMSNRPEWVVSAFAISLVGGVLIPVNTFATASERDHILRHSDASVLLMQPRLAKHEYLRDLCDEHPAISAGKSGALRIPALPNLRRVVTLGSSSPGSGVDAFLDLASAGKEIDDVLLDALSAEVTPSDDGVMIYTSGTTSKPKGVLHLQRAPVIMSWRFAEYMELDRDDVVFTAQPFFWTAGITMSLGASLAAGSKLVLQEIFAADTALAAIEAEGATTVHAWPHQEKAMAEHPSAASRDLSKVRKVEFTSPLAPLAGLEKDVWGTYGSYGASETFTLSSAIPVSAAAESRSKTSGKPLPGMEISIVDPETGEELADGEKGEIAVRGLTLMRGYYKIEPELVFDARGYYRSQDGGWFDPDGFLHWTGRLSNIIKTGGANVSPLEIDKVLEDRSDLRLAQAVGVPHDVLGEAIVLCVLPMAGAAPTENDLRGFLRERLSAYKVPKRVLFFEEGEIEYTANQKLQVTPLREAALAKLAAEGTVIDGYAYRVEEGAEEGAEERAEEGAAEGD